MFKKIKNCFSRKKNKTEEKPKEIIYFGFESFKKISEKAIYKKHPLLILIEKNKINILDKLIASLKNDFKVAPKIGIEIEFYLYKEQKTRGQKSDAKQVRAILDEIYKNASEAGILITKCDKERGKGQIEARTKPYTDIKKLAKDFEKLKKIIITHAKEEGFVADFRAQPFADDCGNALQINISLLGKGGKNLFERVVVDGEKEESELLLHCVGGLCELMNVSMPFFVKSEECHARYNLKLNKFLHSQGKYPAPTFVSWGINNRTTAIRIPVTIFKTIEKYKAEGDRNRRIEHRVPSAEADIYNVLIGVLFGVIYGLKNKVISNTKSYFNVFEKNEGLKEILREDSEGRNKKFEEFYGVLV